MTYRCRLPTGLLGFVLRRQARRRHVHTLHGVSFDYLTACRAYLNWRCYTAMLSEMLLSRYADHVIAVSRRTATAGRHCFGLPAAKVTVIPNGHAESPRHPNARADFRRRFELDDSHFVAAFIGRGEDPVKGTAAITAAMQQLSGPFKNLRLLAVPGNGLGLGSLANAAEASTATTNTNETMVMRMGRSFLLNSPLFHNSPAAMLPHTAMPCNGGPFVTRFARIAATE